MTKFKKMRKKKSKKPRKPIFTVQNIKTVLPFVDAGLAILSNVKQARPYARALRTMTAVASTALPDPLVEIVNKLAILRTQVTQLENSQSAANPTPTLQRLRAEQDAYTDLLIQQVKGI